MFSINCLNRIVIRIMNTERHLWSHEVITPLIYLSIKISDTGRYLNFHYHRTILSVLMIWSSGTRIKRLKSKKKPWYLFHKSLSNTGICSMMLEDVGINSTESWLHHSGKFWNLDLFCRFFVLVLTKSNGYYPRMF